MKHDLSGLSQHYVMSLRKHLKAGARAGLKSARARGREALESGLETLDMARIHEKAVIVLGLSSGSARLSKRADLFFAESITPIEGTHPAAIKASVLLSKMKK